LVGAADYAFANPRYGLRALLGIGRSATIVIASGAKQSSLAGRRQKLDCFVASLLAMTGRERRYGTDLPDGQISKNLSSPICKNIPVLR
jgi:hypothetical protein